MFLPSGLTLSTQTTNRCFPVYPNPSRSSCTFLIAYSKAKFKSYNDKRSDFDNSERKLHQMLNYMEFITGSVYTCSDWTNYFHGYIKVNCSATQRCSSDAQNFLQSTYNVCTAPLYFRPSVFHEHTL